MEFVSPVLFFLSQTSFPVFSLLPSPSAVAGALWLNRAYLGWHTLVTLSEIVSGLLLGVLEAMGAAYISIAWKDAIAFGVLILILIFRPTGLLGERVAEKI